jgi:hypothetical protein
MVSAQTLEGAMGIIWTIIIGFIAGVVAKFLHPGRQYEPQGFIWTTLLGIAGAFVASLSDVRKSPKRRECLFRPA